MKFINRTSELDFLNQCLVDAVDEPALVIVSGPTGVGKSSLSDRFRELKETKHLAFCAVDPELLDSPASRSIYQGLFLQKCAVALDERSRLPGASWPTFSDFLKGRRWQAVKEKPKHELLAELPSVKSLYKQAMDYASRILMIGKFRAEYMLSSDQSHAISTCILYSQFVLDRAPMVLIVREAQLIDSFSLRTLLGWQLTGTPTHLIIEYTTEEGLHPAHQKDLLRAADLRKGFSSLAIEKLGADHFKALLHETSHSSGPIQTEAYLHWDGNIRSIEEVRFLARGGAISGTKDSLRGLLENIDAAIAHRILNLPSDLRIILALLHANVEAINVSVLRETLVQANPNYRATRLPEDLSELIEEQRLVLRSPGGLRLENENIARVIEAEARMKPLLALAQKSLREHYRLILKRGSTEAIDLGGAVRQVFRLCVVTRDTTGLVEACEELLEHVRTAEDHRIYVDSISSALQADESDVTHSVTSDLKLWGARLAYEVSDWQQTVRLIDTSAGAGVLAQTLLGFSLQEIGRHSEALAIASDLTEHDRFSGKWLAGRLLELVIRGCQGDVSEAKRGLVEIQKDAAFENSPLLGYAFRFMDIVDDLPTSLLQIEKSVSCFQKHGLKKAEAYSRLAAAIPLARLGRIKAARKMLSAANNLLRSEVYDRHLVLNNVAAVELLDRDPDAEWAIEQLEQALRYAIDDFCELTITTNLAIAYFLCGRMDRASRLSLQVLNILRNHDFADTDIYWPAVFNIRQIFSAANQDALRRDAEHFLAENGRPSTNQSYWDYRFGRSEECPDTFRYLAKRQLHPLYLSHWAIELEALERLD